MDIDQVPVLSLMEGIAEPTFASDDALSAAITRAASKQTYYTIRFLADRDRVRDAYRAYAYFRWVDDWLDQSDSETQARIAFLDHQQALVNGLYQGESVADLLPQEAMLVSLIQTDNDENSGLHAYIRSMMAVMAFDTYRRGRLISQRELDDYSCNLATGVTEALHYFIGHGDDAPGTEERYSAVTGAHITHMLRDTYEDVAAGYFNIASEFLKAHGLDPCDLQNDAYRSWVESRVRLARRCFAAGREYLAQVRNRRCRIAGYAYIARFECVLNAIEREGFRLRPQYLERNRLSGRLRIGWSALSMFVAPPVGGRA